ncbi:MAG: HAMP domain-containing histidine kinase [Proteobacteria bacterium]|nr:HAMP domain-containing histidine kinase [Pseudomonadota bacterium]
MNFVQQVVESHKGEVAVGDSLSGGAVFTMRFPKQT